MKKYIEPAIDSSYAGAWHICTKCARRMPHTHDFFHIHSVNGHRYLRPNCKVCAGKRRRKYYEEKRK